MRNDWHVDIGGRCLHIHCQGQGQPAVILEAGMGDTLATWAAILPILAQETQVCSYDRAGLGESDPVPTPRSIGGMVADLQNLLDRVEIAGPYLLVGHSFGAQIVRLFAARHPDAVAGLILIDPSHEDKYARFEQVLTAALITRQNAYLADPSRNSEAIDLLYSRTGMQDTHRSLPVPLIILTRGQPDPPSPVWPTVPIQALEEELQEETLTFSSWRGRQRITATGSGHYIHHNQPELVIAAIREVITAYQVLLYEGRL